MMEAVCKGCRQVLIYAIRGQKFPTCLLSNITLLREEMMSLPWEQTERGNMATKQRGKGASLVKKAENKKGAHDFNLALDSSDDEAPEEVTFEDSKARAVESLKLALDTARREKELLKEKRRKRQELFQEQKKKKLLSADVLEEIDSVPSKKQKQAEDKDEEEEKKKRKTKKPTGVRNLKGSYTVSTVTNQGQSDYQRQAAEDFIQSRLYGPGSCRSSNNEMLSLQNKTRADKSAAVQFVKKDWACKEKAKAEKLKKRWIHKQQIPTS
ncbi:nucleolar protein 7 [Gambusia affinis]|uniref:nucleolar protein 7 n=1 Tax=Gambusia affinis TaxID=33528 RepID=UPI001CDB63B4|nr:nucleolar protein 7 [Gambusia affinis]XP_043991246.1 nucleolar protein 7 [Gambusia affinis]XP_043991247.1 nucleolar protein 7 [Gambusia affinis]